MAVSSATRRIDPAPGYAALFDRLAADLPGAVGGRRASFERFGRLGFPTTRAEAWKYTNLRALADLEPRAPHAVAPDLAELEPYLLTGDVRRLVFVNGRFVGSLSDMARLPSGLRVRTLAESLDGDADLPMDVDGERALTALNAALVQDGAVIEVEAEAEIAPAVQLLFVDAGNDADTLTNVRNRVVLGAGARLRMAETHLALGGGGIVNVVNDFAVAEGAELAIDKLMFGAAASRSFGQSVMRVAKAAKLGQTTIVAGGSLVRNESLAKLEGPNADLDLNGAYMPAKSEQVDTVIRVEHLAPNCESNQFYKGILAAGGHGVFAGKIFVDQVAQKTNAYQQNDNLMLSRDAEIDTKPELEIYADDVKCSHGATVGELDEQALFYLRSRGIDRQTAATILTFAFAGEVVERLHHEDSRHQARRALLGRLEGGEQLMELV